MSLGVLQQRELPINKTNPGHISHVTRGVWQDIFFLTDQAKVSPEDMMWIRDDRELRIIVDDLVDVDSNQTIEGAKLDYYQLRKDIIIWFLWYNLTYTNKGNLVTDISYLNKRIYPLDDARWIDHKFDLLWAVICLKNFKSLSVPSLEYLKKIDPNLNPEEYCRAIDALIK